MCKVSKEIIVSHCGYPRFDLLMTPLKTFFVFERTFEKKEKDNEFIEMSVSKIENFSKEERGGGGLGWGGVGVRGTKWRCVICRKIENE